MPYVIPKSTTCNRDGSIFINENLLYEESTPVDISTAYYGLYLYASDDPTFELVISMGKRCIMETIKISTYSSSGYEAVKDFEFSGVNPDGTEVLLAIGTIPEEYTPQLHEFDIVNTKSEFETFKFKCISAYPGNGGGETAMARLHLYEHERLVLPIAPPISHENVNVRFTLPMNSTKNILSRKDDVRLGMVGIANDGVNFGTMYAINKERKASLVQSRMKSEVIFEGLGGGLNQAYILAKRINTFSYLAITASISDTTADNYNKITNYIDVSDIRFIDNEFLFNFTVNDIQRSISIKFNTDLKSFTITDQQLGDLTSIQVCRVVGIY